MLLLNFFAVAALLVAYISYHFPPSVTWYFALAGLGYPLIVLCNLFFIVYWLFVRRKFMWISIIGLLIGMNHLSAMLQWNFRDYPEEGENTLKVMSYNVRLLGLYSDKGTGTRDSIFALIRQESPDVVCFQEFYHGDQKPKFSTRDYIVKNLPLRHYHERYTHSTSGREFFGVAMFSRYPIIRKGYIPFEGDVNNFCIYADIVKEGDTIRVFDGHLASIRFQKEDYAFFDQVEESQTVEKDMKRVFGRLRKGYLRRMEQAEKVAAEVSKSPYPVILCGDFNDTPFSYCYNVMTSDLDDAFCEKGSGVGNTYNGSLPGFLRIDYILKSESIRTLDFKTFPHAYSDHHPVMAEFALKDGK
ncbi:MAG: hypothetical protein RL220_580 [Bacteroidota bacterium]